MGDNVIKSVRRVFEILELFDQMRCPLPAIEVARRLDYPLTSAHALLKSMHELGYFDYDAPKWSYMPSRSFPAVLDWVRDFLDSESNIIDFMAALNQETQETINLSRRVHTQAKIIFGFESVHPVGVSVKTGTLMSATSSLTGITALSGLDDAELDKFYQLLQARDPDQFDRLDKTLIDEVFDELKQCGTTSRCDLFVKGIGAVCFPVKTSTENTPLVIGVVGPSHRIEQNTANYRRIIKRLAGEFNITTLFKMRPHRI